MKNEKAWIIIFFFIAILLRFLYFFSNPIPTVMPDTYGYNSVGYRILEGKMPLINDERTPLYPLLLNVMTRIAGRTDNRLDTPEFILGSQYLTFFQSVVFLVALLFFYKTLKILKIPLVFRLVSLYLLSSNFYLLFYERVLLTESLSVSLVIITTYIGIKLILKPQFFYFLLSTFYFLLLFLLRPVFLLFPLTLFPLVMILNRTKKILVPCLLSLFVFYLLPSIFYFSNIHNYSYSGINHITDVNVLGRILKNNISVESAKTNKFYQPVMDYRKKGGFWDPYYFLFAFDPTLLTRDNNRKELGELQKFTKTVMINQLPMYIFGGIKDIPSALLESPSSPPNISAKYYLLWNLLYQISRGTQILLSVFIPISILLFLYKLIAKSYTLTTFYIQSSIFYLLFSILYLLLTTVLFGYSDFGRLLLPIVPILILQAELILYNK
jgi:hypothetical protein